MTLLGLFLVLIAIGIGLYLIGQIPMDPTILTVIRIVGIVVAVFLVLQFFGVTGDLGTGCNHRLK